MCDERMWSGLTPLLGDGVDCRFVPLQAAHDRAAMRQTIAEHSAPAANLVAFSLGAYLALEHALAHPERVNSLVLIAASAKGLEADEIARRQRTMKVLASHAYAGMSAAQLREFVHPANMGDPAVVGVIQQMALDLGKELLLAQFAASMERADLLDRLSELHCPVLLVGSEGDQKVAAADLGAMQAHCPNSRLTMLDGCGHMIPLEAPQALAATIREFYLLT
ncbi:alpha/beta fold hydrolase [Duganella sp. LX47W]|uniref:Alpha/beta fold hydrolase n=2 Tax=Rugamonas apoptosis TaxID=2758570 RepID=A0A7W2IKH8_9BURK|nr:alpha/beta fold hydrolase [Rugamonas apoptosis]